MKNTRKLLIMFACLVVLIAMLSVTAYATDNLTVTIDTSASVTLKDTDGNGYYEIGTADELYAFAALVNNGNTTIKGEMTADITVNENVLNADGTLNGTPARAWTPIGTKEQPYAGSFNGNNKTISGLYYNNSASDYVGLFGYASATGGKIQYITINDSYFCGNNCVGAVVGRSYISLYQCINNSAVVGNTYIGGVVGYSEYYSIERSANYKEVTGKEYVGGIVGYCSGDVDYSINYGNVTGERSIGGISGYIGGMSSCGINVGNVYGSSYVGAIYGYITSGGTHGYGYYLEGCATTDEGTVQKGVGKSGTGSYEFEYGDKTVAVSAERFASGEIAYIATYYQLKQNIGTDSYPSFAGATVYCYKDCAYNSHYTNDESLSGTTADHVWENGVCTVCSVACSHESYSEGFCTACGAECPHSWSSSVCTLCNVTCTHESYTKGVCDECGKICSHSYNSSNKCTICGFAKILYSGTCSYINDTPTWTLDADGVLTVSGTGEMEKTPWTSYKSQIKKVVIEDGVTSIYMHAFDSCYYLKNVSIADSVTAIGDSAFYWCNGLTEIDIPDGVTSIGDYVFYRCTGLTEITIPDGVTSIGDSAFYWCTGLTEITIPDSVTSFGTSALSGCSSLTEISIPNGVTSIGKWAFDGCSSLTDVYYDGYESQWNQITIGEYNEYLTGATIHFKECSGHTGGAATCTEKAVCAICGESYGDEPAGHSTTAEGDRAATCTAKAYCSVCQKEYGDEPAGHSYIDNKCSACGTAQITYCGTNTTLGTVLDLNFAFSLCDVDENAKAIITRSYADDRADDVQTINKADWSEQEGYYLISYKGLAAKEMCDTVSIAIYDQNGDTITVYNTEGVAVVCSDSIRSYAERALANGSLKETEKTLLTEMLDYGAEAQKQFGYNTADLANGGSYNSYTGSGVTSEGCTAVGGNYMGTSLILESCIEMQMGFKDIEGIESAAVSYTNHYGTEKSFNITAEDIVTYYDTNGNVAAYAVVIPEIVVADARQVITVTVTPVNGETITVTDSIAGYVARNNSAGVYGAIMDFADAAYAYFHPNAEQEA